MKSAAKSQKHRVPPLNPRDERVLQFIRSFQLREGLTPTREEIASGLGFDHLMTAQRSIMKLKQHGKIQVSENSKRSITIVESETSLSLPLLGTVAAGRPIEAIERDEKIQVPQSMVKGGANHFVLKVAGDSMIEDHICSGDYVVIRQQETAKNGDRVVALIDHDVTLKKFYLKQGRVELHPSNSTMKPILVEAHQVLRVLGIYVGLIRFNV